MTGVCALFWFCPTKGKLWNLTEQFLSICWKPPSEAWRENYSRVENKATKKWYAWY